MVMDGDRSFSPHCFNHSQGIISGPKSSHLASSCRSIRFHHNTGSPFRIESSLPSSNWRFCHRRNFQSPRVRHNGRMAPPVADDWRFLLTFDSVSGFINQHCGVLYCLVQYWYWSERSKTICPVLLLCLLSVHNSPESTGLDPISCTFKYNLLKKKTGQMLFCKIMV